MCRSGTCNGNVKMHITAWANCNERIYNVTGSRNLAGIRTYTTCGTPFVKSWWEECDKSILITPTTTVKYTVCPRHRNRVDYVQGHEVCFICLLPWLVHLIWTQVKPREKLPFLRSWKEMRGPQISYAWVIHAELNVVHSFIRMLEIVGIFLSMFTNDCFTPNFFRTFQIVIAALSSFFHGGS
ncbi:hypothetical protein ASPBRDRAFT_285633 [Aspergillus brasiliensis CBS 101740]|uniref:Uncharacterized protein n=1 Tax=Aspergillus brasiliensis (strain CBS 101740 / IMI 381727 / IBT 21946) TaxID=767769 RepID=A0A1L9UDG0_ASPBC|nr:hypothetical protein ASPBRDRAFT_285633 [Aspergillus brasiliensis CBS 101740]